MRMRVLSTRDKDKSKDNSKDTDKGKDKDKDIAPHEHQDNAYEGESIVRGLYDQFHVLNYNKQTPTKNKVIIKIKSWQCQNVECFWSVHPSLSNAPKYLCFPQIIRSSHETPLELVSESNDWFNEQRE